MGAVLDAGMSMITGDKEKSQEKAIKEITGLAKQVQLPDINQMKLDLDTLVLEGEITPEEAQAVLLERSAMEGISTDPRLKDAQMAALQGLQEIVDGEGLTARDKANLARIQTEVGSQAKGAREAILQNAQQRGVGGSGLELMAQLEAQQSAATRGSQMGLETAAMAQERALQALQQAGTLGGQLRTQEFGEQSDVAKAKDAIARFNQDASQQAQMANVSARNKAQELNLSERQRIADKNTELRNAEQQANKNLAQIQYDNEMKKLGAVSGALGQQAQMYGQQAQARTDLLGTAAQSGATAYASDVNVKKDIEKADISSMLDKLTGYKYSYKKPSLHGEGPQVGVMAQDLEKSELGSQAVAEDMDGVKRVDYNKLGGPILAALAEINKRVNSLEDKKEEKK